MYVSMTYSLDLRKRVIAFVEGSGSKAEASRQFSVSRKTVYNWLSCDDLTPKRHGPRRRKLDRDALKRDVELYPDSLLRERAVRFGVYPNAIWCALRKLDIRHKKTDAISGTQT